MLHPQPQRQMPEMASKILWSQGTLILTYPSSSVYIIPERKEGIGADRNVSQFVDPFLFLCFSE